MANILKFPIGSGPTDVKEQRAVSDAVMNERHKMFDLQAKDNHMKYERAKFAVVGEGTRSAQENYRAGYERTFGNKEDEPRSGDIEPSCGHPSADTRSVGSDAGGG